MKFLRVVALIIAILFLLFCLVGSQRAWFGIIIFIIGLYLQKQYRKGKIQFSKSRYIMTFGLLAAFILTLTSPTVTQPVKQTASEAKSADTAVKAEEEKAKEADKKKEEAAAAKLAEQKKQEEARKEAEAKKQAEAKRLEEEAKKQAEQKRLEEEAKKQAELKRLEEERKKQEQEQAEAAAQEAERKRKEQEAAAAEQAQSTESFDNCTEMRTVHPKGVPSTHPAYESQHDRDKDNWACER
ncbi:excalibur calcium-binding domain-containing protein [Metabacillus sp. cB07]|uniref:excalibur calcium-binding domain-containing protein n=1 Tax=Metabacillus sp. cB07 TaxID=2806989 RepID=UPI00193A6B28|nr:excalibur calcium-binding domain-containing protein [Metabacillus sp. cB07]